MTQSLGVRKPMLRYVIFRVLNMKFIFYLLSLYIGSFTIQVGCRLIDLLINSAFIQPPVDQLGDGPPDIRPAFVHDLKNVKTNETL